MGESLENRLLLTLAAEHVGSAGERTVEVGALALRTQTQTVLGNELFFADEDEGGRELWKTDGTAEGTTRVADIWPGPQGSNPQNLVAIGDAVYFLATDGIHGPELWKSDGTEEGTVLVSDLWPGTEGSAPRSLTGVGGTLYFVANDGKYGDELWKSDGSAAGTELVADLNLDDALRTPDKLTDVNGTLFFSTRTRKNGYSWRSLWTSDGTSEGTVELVDQSLKVEEMVGLDGRLLLVGSTPGSKGGNYGSPMALSRERRRLAKIAASEPAVHGLTN